MPFVPGREQEVTAPDGSRWRLGRLELSRLFAWRDWIARQIGDPYDHAEALIKRFGDVLPREEQIALVKEARATALELQGFSMGSPLAQRFLRSEEGLARLVHGLLLAAQPQATLDDAYAVVQALGTELDATLAKASGEAPGPNAAAPAA